ncbi:NUDIX domain-containing protein [Histidinibacterium aquaticum]|uniref:NUDIX domain-containing protein n=1 Tax=Histidinibacterium aquaticum TaxID=2613962 RepID=A0A5J5GF18_9RHOB|nr:NUDIX domain-containing protein [Histidinibacterium aquaticum]KAA9006064.1 NUDIX domain-containing protein [Histidinibacterium aquaticum]
MEQDDFNGSKVALFLGPRLLVFLRDRDPGIDWPGAWDLPGGGREGAESPWETLLREVEEEAGLDLRPAEVLWRERSEGLRGPVWFWVARLPEEALRGLLFGEEGSAWALMTPERVLRLEGLVPHHRARLERYRALAGAWGAPVT